MSSSLPILRKRRERRLERQRQKGSRRRSLLLGTGVMLSITILALILTSALAYARLTRDLPAIVVLPKLLNPPDGMLLQPTRMYDRSGEHLLITFASSESPRRYFPLAESNPQHIPEILVQAVVAVVDPQFWSHSGYSLEGIDHPEVHPTIAQKLAYDLLLYGEPPTRERALRERLLAAQITARFGRTQVLEWYLNSASFGRYAYGVDSASQLYFGTSADQLTLAELAMLAGIVQAPVFNPIDAPSVALQRGREVIRLLAELDLVDQAETASALSENPDIEGNNSTPGPLITGKGVEAFINLAMLQLDSQFGRDRIEHGGLRILTTLDYDLQQQTLCATEVFAQRLAGKSEVVEGCQASNWLPSLPPGVVIPDHSVSALILDPKAGQVLAVVGETIQAKTTPLFTPHDPGSSVDVFVYLTGFTRGLSPASLVWDIPGKVQNSNINGQFHGPMRLRTALANGYPAPVEAMIEQMGTQNVASIAKSFGISMDEPVGLLELAGAFGVFGTQGVYLGQDMGASGYLPAAVLNVEELDHTVWLDWRTPQSRTVVSAGLAYLMTNALGDESARVPSLGSPNPLEIGRPAAVKLGQTEDGAQNWVIGYTPEYVVATWSGTSSGTRQALRTSSILYSGLMQYVSRDSQPADWPVPEDVIALDVCDPSGLLPGSDCPNIVREVFLAGSEPHQVDELYRNYLVNRETGLLATVFTPQELVEKRLYMLVPPEARHWAQSTGLPIPPDTYDAIQPPPVNPDVKISAPALFSEVSGKVRVTGSAAGDDFVSYRVLAGKGLNPQEWIEVAANESPVQDGLLATWDTQGISGLYAMQLVVTRTDQRVDTAITQVTIVDTDQ